MARRQNKSGSPTPRKKKGRGPRVALYLPRDPGQLHTRGMAMWAAVKADTAHFPTPYPPATEIEGDLGDLGNLLQKAENGDPVTSAALQSAADKVRSTLGRLGKYVESVVRAGPVEDASAIIASVLMYESKVGTRKPKAELEARDGVTSGDVLLIALAIAGATAYFWDSSLDQTNWVEGARTSQATAVLMGLTPGKLYYFRVRALLRGGKMTNPSVVVSMIVK